MAKDSNKPGTEPTVPQPMNPSAPQPVGQPVPSQPDTNPNR